MFFCIAKGMDGQLLINAAAVVYAVYMATNKYRNMATPTADRVQDALEQFAKNARAIPFF